MKSDGETTREERRRDVSLSLSLSLSVSLSLSLSLLLSLFLLSLGGKGEGKQYRPRGKQGRDQGKAGPQKGKAGGKEGESHGKAGPKKGKPIFGGASGPIICGTGVLRNRPESTFYNIKKGTIVNKRGSKVKAWWEALGGWHGKVQQIRFLEF